MWWLLDREVTGSTLGELSVPSSPYHFWLITIPSRYSTFGKASENIPKLTRLKTLTQINKKSSETNFIKAQQYAKWSCPFVLEIYLLVFLYPIRPSPQIFFFNHMFLIVLVRTLLYVYNSTYQIMYIVNLLYSISRLIENFLPSNGIIVNLRCKWLRVI